MSGHLSSFISVSAVLIGLVCFWILSAPSVRQASAIRFGRAWVVLTGVGAVSAPPLSTCPSLFLDLFASGSGWFTLLLWMTPVCVFYACSLGAMSYKRVRVFIVSGGGLFCVSGILAFFVLLERDPFSPFMAFYVLPVLLVFALLFLWAALKLYPTKKLGDDEHGTA